MKPIALILAFTIIALAGKRAAAAETVSFHSALVVGSLNKGIDPSEYWGKLRITNTAQRAETVALTARRYNGTLFQSARLHPKENPCELSNLSSEPKTVLYCAGLSIVGCDTGTELSPSPRTAP